MMNERELRRRQMTFKERMETARERRLKAELQKWKTEAAEERMKRTNKVLLPGGRYYVGDLCYLLGDFWDEVCAATGVLGIYRVGTTDRLPKKERTGSLTWRGIPFFCSHTAYGDGVYSDDSGRTYWVDAGSIGCFPLSPELHMPGEAPRGGHYIDFPEDFTCRLVNDRGTIRIGRVRIETAGSDEDDEWGDEE